MDAPRLMVEVEVHDILTGIGYERREPTVPEVVAWLRERRAVDYADAFEAFAASLYTIWERGYHVQSVGPWQPEWVGDFLEANPVVDAALSPTGQEGER